MTISLKRGNESVEIIGDDSLLVEYSNYRATFDKQVQLVTMAFYDIKSLSVEERPL